MASGTSNSTDRLLGRLVDVQTVFFMCDMQDGFRQYVPFYQEIITVAQRLVSAKTILNLWEHFNFILSLTTTTCTNYFTRRKISKPGTVYHIVRDICGREVFHDNYRDNY